MRGYAVVSDGEIQRRLILCGTAGFRCQPLQGGTPSADCSETLSSRAKYEVRTVSLTGACVQ
ncbi:hypothetical protein DF3PA_200014 [Candidatus Defluviicoccus seviourii]|uniref:Uncharacterized protein n=1 Tax=Candidatus Defluviicoccus seviourii TaxID=2565273 RepID=A0A564WCY8_9PROT|nr:hypothetical protein DF3PA_200014 [Candidatus Defluviicoccus seviourii]